MEPPRNDLPGRQRQRSARLPRPAASAHSPIPQPWRRRGTPRASPRPCHHPPGSSLPSPRSSRPPACRHDAPFPQGHTRTSNGSEDRSTRRNSRLTTSTRPFVAGVAPTFTAASWPTNSHCDADLARGDRRPRSCYRGDSREKRLECRVIFDLSRSVQGIPRRGRANFHSSLCALCQRHG